MTEESLRSKVLGDLKKTHMIYLATSSASQPRVRPVTMIHFDDKFWVFTGTDTAKVNQIRENPNIEFCLPLQQGDNSGYIRGSGKAIIVHDSTTKKTLANNTPFFKEYWKSSDDPTYTLLQIIISEVEYLKPGDFAVKKFSP